MRETVNLKHLYRKELDKVCFAHDAAYSKSKDLAKRTISDKILKTQLMKLLEIVNIINIKQHQQVWSIRFFDKKKTESWMSLIDQLGEELRKQVINKIKRTKGLFEI